MEVTVNHQTAWEGRFSARFWCHYLHGAVDTMRDMEARLRSVLTLGQSYGARSRRVTRSNAKLD